MLFALGSRLLAASLVIVLSVSAAFAQTPDRTVPGWNYRDPVNIAESRVYARLFFAYKDTGVISDEFRAFRFTNPAPQGADTPFRAAEEVFDKIYADRLNYTRDGVPLYSLADLRRDDPQVEAAFRRFATTGVLKTPLTGDVDVLNKHLEAIADAATAGDQFVFADSPSLAIVDGALESSGLLAQQASSSAAVTASISSQTVVASTIRGNLPGVPRPIPYWPDGEAPCTGGVDDGMFPDDGFCVSPGHPGFDCDDYARAWAAWLKRHLTQYPDAKYFVLYVWWGDHAHAVVAILIDGKYYLVDPQTGTVVGPIDEGTWFSPTDFGPGLKELLERYGNPTGPFTWKKHPPDYVDPNDVKPWYTDPDVRDWFRRKFPGMNPDDFIWPQ